jgi:hypothetical protein
LRADPDFIIIGAQRGGTTSVQAWLGAHEAVARARAKEIHYFDLYYDRGRGWYRGHFPYRFRLHGRITGEATPALLYDARAAERVARDLPKVKLIALLRNPTDRAWSQWWLNRSRGHEPLEFEEAIAREPERLRAGGDGRLRYAYVSRGMYAEQLERWFDAVGRERVLVLESERLPDDQTRRRLCDFLGIAASSHPFPHRNARALTSLDPALQAQLDAAFREPNARLAALLPDPPSWAR